MFIHSVRSMSKNVAVGARALLLGMVVMLWVAFAAKAQDTGYIGGTVTDKSGAAVAGAEVVLTASAGGLTRTTTSNGDGAYVISGLPGGTYDIVVTAKGFQKYEAKQVVLDVAAKIRVDVQMTVGAINEEVVVTGESVAQVETQSSELSDTITGKQVNQLVLNGRNFTQLVTLSPGVVNQQGYDEGIVGITANVSFSINGGRVEYNNWELDGGDNMDNGSNSTLNVYPNPEAIAEFKVLESNYGAQYGRNGSGTVEVETKSGGSSFHGSAFEYLRNDMFNAKPWSSGGIPGDPNPPYKKHDFGYTLGGPVYIPHHYNSDKKKTFFFWSQEWRRQRDPYSILQNVPSAQERTGNFNNEKYNGASICPVAGTPFIRQTDSTVPMNTTTYPDCPGTVFAGQFIGDQQEWNTFPNNTITPTAVGTALLAEIPGANTTTSGYPAVGTTISLPTTWREELVRIDHNITDKYRLTFRYIHDSWQTQTPNPLWGNGSSFENINTNFVGPGTSFVARMNANFSPTLLNEFVASYTADHIFLTTVNNPPLPSGFAMTPLFNNGFTGKLPSFVMTNNAEYGGGFNGDTGYFPWNNANPTYTYRDNVTKIIGVHTLQFGAYAITAEKNEDNSPYNQGILTFSATSPVSTGNGFADLLLGNVAQYSQANQTVKYYNRWKVLEPYFQDDWRLNRHLTLNLGMRFSLYGTYREKYQHAFDFNPNAFVAGGSPAIDNTGNTTGQVGAFVSGAGNPFNGIVQCGGKGGTGFVPANVLTAFPGATVGASSNAGCMSGHLFNPAPRIGFAFDPKGDGKMAIRGGYGIFFEHTNGNEGNTESLEGSAPLAFTASQFNTASGTGTCPASSEGGYTCIGGAGLLFPLTVTSIPNQVKWPYVQQWNLGVQRELPSHFVASVAYVGSKGTHLTLESDLNQLQPFTGTNPYPAGQPIVSADCNNFTVSSTTGLPTAATLGNGKAVPSAAVPNLWVACGNSPQPFRPDLGFGNITSLQDAANSIYNALQATVKRTVGDLTMSVAYTYSHSIDDSSDRYDAAFVNSYNLAANRGASTFDQRHSLAVSYVYALPLFKGSGLTHTLLGGWQASGITIAQTGQPFSVTNGTFGDSAGVGNGVGTGSRPDLVGNPYDVTAAQKAAAAAAGARGQLYYNPNAFAQPTGLTFGDVGRDTLYYPGRLNFDFGLFKRFVFGGEDSTKELDFRWENFNLFNHTQFNSINSSNSSNAFLVLNGTHEPRRMQFGLRLQF